MDLIEMMRSGTAIGPGGTESERWIVNAQELRTALRQVAMEVEPSGITVQNAFIDDELDLANMSIHAPLVFVNCDFAGPLNIEGSDLRALHFVGGNILPGVLGNGCRIRGDLLFENITVTGGLKTLGSSHHRAAIWLCEADIGGRLLLRNARLVGQDGARSLHADRLRLGANLRLLDGSEVVGEFRLLSARIAGSLDIVSSTITGEEWAVDLSEAQIDGSLFIMDDRRFGDQRGSTGFSHCPMLTSVRSSGSRTQTSLDALSLRRIHSIGQFGTRSASQFLGSDVPSATTQ
jgi:hypothetical protein